VAAGDAEAGERGAPGEPGVRNGGEARCGARPGSGLASRAGLLALLALLSASAASARDRIDVVKLVNGDQITCEIVQLESGYLTVRTASFGTVEIEWTDVEALISIQLFDIERSDGVRFQGRFDEGVVQGTLLLRQGDEELFAIPHADVFSIRQLGASIWRSRRGHLNAGLDYTHASDESKFSLDAELTFQGKRFRFKNTLTSSISDDAASDRRERTTAESGLEIPLGKLFALVTRASYNRNDELDLDSRINVAGAAIWIPWRGARGRYWLGAGAVQSEERYRGEPSGHSVTGAVALTGGEYHRFGKYGTVASIELAYIPILTGESRYRIEATASFSQELVRDFNFAVSPYYSFDSRPPRPTLNDEDWGWISSLGWTF
jgi:hypothetical protein